MIGKTQAVNEDVLTFRDRLLNDAMPFRPIHPSMDVIARSPEGKDVLITNSRYEIQKIEYLARMKKNKLYLTQFYTKELRREIVHKMQTVDFNTLEAAAKAAKQAEDYLKQTEIGRASCRERVCMLV